MKTATVSIIALVIGFMVGFGAGNVSRSTPAAIPTPTKTPVAISVSYNDAMAAQMQTFGNAVGVIVPLIQEPRLLDNDWRATMAIQGAVLEGVYESIAKLTPPSDQVSRHVDVLSATADCAASMRAMTLAIDTASAEAATASGALLGRCSEKLAAVANQ